LHRHPTPPVSAAAPAPSQTTCQQSAAPRPCKSHLPHCPTYCPAHYLSHVPLTVPFNLHPRPTHCRAHYPDTVPITVPNPCPAHCP
jgi:hypothetical protein